MHRSGKTVAEWKEQHRKTAGRESDGTADAAACKKMLADRYASFDGGKGKEFEDGKLTLEDVVAYAKANGEPKQTSGKQELYEAIVNMYC